MNEICRQVTNDSIAMQLVGKTAAKNKSLSVKDTAFRIQVKLKSNTVGSSTIMTFGKGFLTDWNIFALTV